MLNSRETLTDGLNVARDEDIDVVVLQTTLRYIKWLTLSTTTEEPRVYTTSQRHSNSEPRLRRTWTTRPDWVILSLVGGIQKIEAWLFAPTKIQNSAPVLVVHRAQPSVLQWNIGPGLIISFSYFHTSRPLSFKVSLRNFFSSARIPWGTFGH